jgi:hypothetical protein
MRGWAAAFVVLVAALGGSATASVDTPQVTVIGDSVLTAVQWNPGPRAILEDGIDMRVDIGICRRVTGESCPFDGARVPTLIDVVNSLGPKLGKVVLVEVGYNDDHDTFAQSVEQAISALLDAGVQRILWANLRGFDQHWLDMNAALDAAALRHPELTVVDWHGYALPHWSWFQSDSVHLVLSGATAMATLFRKSIDEIIAPVVINPAPLPLAHVGRPYTARFRARGGIGGPYGWRVVQGSLLRGLSLRPSGEIDGVPRRSGRINAVVAASDRTGLVATRRLRLEIASVD